MRRHSRCSALDAERHATWCTAPIPMRPRSPSGWHTRTIIAAAPLAHTDLESKPRALLADVSKPHGLGEQRRSALVAVETQRHSRDSADCVLYRNGPVNPRRL